MPLTDYAEKALLDWCFGAAVPTRPAQRWISFATASPTSQSAFDGPFNTRVSVRMGVAASPVGSVSLATAASLATATAAATTVGWNIWDSTVGGTRLAYGTWSAAIGCKSADNPQIGAGSLTITIA